MKMLNIKKLIALVLSVSLLLGIVATSASADEGVMLISDEEIATTEVLETESTTIAEETTTEVSETETTTVADETTTLPATEETTDAPVVAPSDATPRRISVVVNGDTKSSKGITWFTTANTSSVVEITTADGEKVSANIVYTDVTEWEGNFMHKATVTGLAAGTTFRYRVGNGTLFSDWGTFVTDNGDDKVNFVAIADIQASNLENFIKGAETAAAAYKVMPDAEFMVNLGDFTDDSTNEEWDYYDTAMADINLNSTLVPIAGNHDGLGVWNWFNNMFNLDTSESVQVLNGVNYSFDYGNAHFAVLNTNDLLSISFAQLTWLKNDMNSTDKDWKIVLMHKSPYSLGKDAKWPDALYLQRSLTSVLDSCGVDLVMSGHDHQYLRTKAIKNGKANEDGTVYVLAGTAGAKRYEVRSFLANNFLDTDILDALVIHKNGYGNYWNGKDWNSTNEDFWGGCFNTISIDGGKLTFDSYILKDRPDEAPMDTPRETITKSDSFTLEKAVGQNKITFTGDNTTSEIEYYLGVVPSFFGLATYAIGEWLPRFLIMVPALLDSVINEDVF